MRNLSFVALDLEFLALRCLFAVGLLVFCFFFAGGRAFNGIPQVWQVTRGALVVKSGVVGGGADPFTPHRAGSAYHLALHRLGPYVCYLV